jgi:hypothetical protein
MNKNKLIKVLTYTNINILPLDDGQQNHYFQVLWNFLKVAITTEFVLATSEVYSPMANVATFSANTDAHSLGIQKLQFTCICKVLVCNIFIQKHWF